MRDLESYSLVIKPKQILGCFMDMESVCLKLHIFEQRKKQMTPQNI